MPFVFFMILMIGDFVFQRPCRTSFVNNEQNNKISFAFFFYTNDVFFQAASHILTLPWRSTWERCPRLVACSSVSKSSRHTGGVQVKIVLYDNQSIGCIYPLLMRVDDRSN